MGLIDGLVKSLVSRCFKEFFLEELFLESSCTCFGRTKKKKCFNFKSVQQKQQNKIDMWVFWTDSLLYKVTALQHATCGTLKAQATSEALEVIVD